MKKYLYRSLVISLIFLYGCSNTPPTSVIPIDTYILELYTKDSYEKETDLNKIPQIVHSNLLALYTIKKTETSNTFNDSILVMRYPNVYDNLENFVHNNTEDINGKNYKESNEKETSLEGCKNRIDMVVKGYQFKDEESPYYFVQSFFLTEKFAYLISAGTDTEETYDDLYHDFKNISCIPSKK